MHHYASVTLALALFLPNAAFAQEPSLLQGFVFFDQTIIECSINQPKRETEFRRRLNPRTACGDVSESASKEVTGSKEYGERVSWQRLKLPRTPYSSREAQYCDTVLKN